MSFQSRTIHGTAVLVSGQALAQAMSFVRNAIVARLLSPDDIGVAAVFWVVMGFLETITNLSVDRLLVQAREGDSQQMQDTAQCVLGLRGLGSGVLIAALAYPLASIFGVPHARWGFYLLATVPIFRGLTHQDINRWQRDLRFGPSNALELTSQFLAMAVAWPLTLHVRDFSAMLWLFALQNAVQCAGSHLLAERRYRWAWHREMARQIGRFGWPLALNGLMLCLLTQGDQFMMASVGQVFPSVQYSKHDLGIYVVAMTLAMAPTRAIAGIASSLLLPLLSHAPNDDLFHKRACWSALGLSACGAFLALPLVTIGGWIVRTVYGEQYAQAGAVVAWLGMMCGIRIIRVAPVITAMAKGDTKNTLLGNLLKSIGLVGAAVAISCHAPVTWIAIAGCGGEVLALLASVISLKRVHQVPLHATLLPSIRVALWTLAAALTVHLLLPRAGIAAVAAVLGLALLGVFWDIVLRDFDARRELTSIFLLARRRVMSTMAR